MLCVQLRHEDFLGLRREDRPRRPLWRQTLEGPLEPAFLGLVNELAGDFLFRVYLTQDKELLENLVSRVAVRSAAPDLLANLIGTLQKLSLRIEAQDLMLSKGIVKELFQILGRRRGELSEYALEYALALLMNLSLNPKAKIIIEEDGELTYLATLMELEADCPAGIRHFLNAAIYAFLWSPAIQRKARATDLAARLQRNAESFDPNIQTQIRYIVDRINGDAVEDSLNSVREIVDLDTLALDSLEQVLAAEFAGDPQLAPFLEKYAVLEPAQIAADLRPVHAYFEAFVRNFNDLVSFNITHDPLERREDVSLALTGRLSHIDKPVTPLTLNEKFSTFSYSQISEINNPEPTAHRRKYLKSRFGVHPLPEGEGLTPVKDWEEGFQSRVVKVQRTPLIKDL